MFLTFVERGGGEGERAHQIARAPHEKYRSDFVVSPTRQLETGPAKNLPHIVADAAEEIPGMGPVRAEGLQNATVGLLGGFQANGAAAADGKRGESPG